MPGGLYQIQSRPTPTQYEIGEQRDPELQEFFGSALAIVDGLYFSTVVEASETPSDETAAAVSFANGLYLSTIVDSETVTEEPNTVVSFENGNYLLIVVDPSTPPTDDAAAAVAFEDGEFNQVVIQAEDVFTASPQTQITIGPSSYDL